MAEKTEKLLTIDEARELVAAEIEKFKASLEKTEVIKREENKVNPVGEEEVIHTFFKDNGEYSDDVYINVSGERIVCQRGVPVKIKRKFLWAYEQAMLQNAKAANVVSEKERSYENRAREVGMY